MASITNDTAIFFVKGWLDSLKDGIRSKWPHDTIASNVIALSEWVDGVIEKRKQEV